MGKRNRTQRARKVKADDFFEIPNAGITVARFGRRILFQSHRTPEQQRALETHLVAVYPKVIAEINARVLLIRQLASQYDPLALLARGFWAMSASMMGKMTEGDCSFDDGIKARMVDYVQAIIVSTPPVQRTVELTDAGWELLHNEIAEVYRALFSQFFIVNSAQAKATQPDYDANYDEFCVRAQTHSTFVRAVRYVAHDFEFLRDFLVPHDDAFQRLFGLSVEQFVVGIREIHDNLCRKSVGALKELLDKNQRAIALADENSDPSGDILGQTMGRLADDPEWNERMKSIFGRLMGLDLFELEHFSSLPTGLVDQLSLSPGEDTKFCSPGDYAGWPLRVFPTRWRPFLRVDGKHYCFDPINIMDDIYRAMQRLIHRLDDAYDNTWKDRQQEATERRPMELLQELLPGATVYRSLHYPVRQNGAGRPEWCELDGLLLYDDLLIAVEVKGGAFTWTPPLTDFPAYLRSIETLLKKPADQASRFLRYLRSDATVQLYDERHDPVASISQGQFRVVVPLCVTLDALTTAAHQISGLRGVGITVAEPVCCLAIDDLRVYKGILPPGVVAAHFIQKRYQTEFDPLVHVTDELDHLGLYLAFVNYVRQATVETNTLGAEVRAWDGYREDIDRYYFLREESPEEAQKPQPAIGNRIREVIDCLNSRRKAGRCHCASVLLDMPKKTREEFDAVFAKALISSAECGEPSAFHIQGESSVTVFCEAPRVRPLSFDAKRELTLVGMIRTGVGSRLLVSIQCDAAGSVVEVEWDNLNIKDIPTDQRERLRALAASQASRRISTHLREHGRIGPNEPCPCCSGRKYKRCCGRTDRLS